MKTADAFMAATLHATVISAIASGMAHAQTTINGSFDVNMGHTGRITSAPPITKPNAMTGSISWEFTPAMQSFVVPAAQLTGLSYTGAAVNYEDLMPLKVSKLSVMVGAPGTAPTGAGTIIDASGIETNALVVQGTATLNGKVVISVPQGDISMGIYQ